MDPCEAPRPFGTQLRTQLQDMPEWQRLIERSRQRSLYVHRLDPQRGKDAQVLPGAELRRREQAQRPMLELARQGMQRLWEQVREAGYVVLLTDADGVALRMLHEDSQGSALRRAGLLDGRCWQESVEGTCAVALGLLERRALTVHHAEHFRAAHRALSCSAAPLQADDGTLLGVLDVTALESPRERASQQLALQLVRAAAALIEDAHFLRAHAGDWVLRVGSRPDLLEVDAALLAMDEAGRVLGASPRLVAMLGSDAATLRASTVEALFDAHADDIVGAAGRCLALTLRDGGRRCFGMVQAPRAAGRASPPRACAPLQTTPRGPAASRVPGEADASAAEPASALLRLAGTDSRMREHARRALRVLDRGIPVLLQGETGTGKERFAQAMHASSARRHGPFVAINCAAIPESLIESELFGYRGGAFTGANAKGARGKLLEADGGTLFLDEIGDMPLGLQTRLLRVLAERQVLALGAPRPCAIDVQLVCATHRDLSRLVGQGSFRLDLLYRINGLTLTLPALRERGDRLQLIEQMLRERAERAGMPEARLAPQALQLLLAHSWPGNLRELGNVLDTALALAEAPWIGPELVRAAVPPQPSTATPGDAADAGAEAVRTGYVDASEATSELRAALQRRHWNVSAAARDLGVCRATLYRRMSREGLVPPRRG